MGTWDFSYTYVHDRMIIITATYEFCQYDVDSTLYILRVPGYIV